MTSTRRRTARRALALAATVGGALALPTATDAADLEAGAVLATQCAACHGPAGVSTSDDFPNLAAQKAGYVIKQLEAFRSGDRADPLMNAIAADLSDTDIENLAAHFASLPGGAPGAVADNATDLDGSLPEFPADWEETFTRYDRIDFEGRKQVRFYWGNDLALDAVRAGGPFPDGAFLLVEIHGAETDADGAPVVGEDGRYVSTGRVAFTAMEKRAGWGDAVPEVLRNGDWRYAVFSLEGENRPGLNEAPCLACHEPLTDTDYAFTHEAIQAFLSAE